MTFEEWYEQKGLPSLNESLQYLTRSAYEAGVAHEREECAKIAEAHRSGYETEKYEDYAGIAACETIADQIRARTVSS